MSQPQHQWQDFSIDETDLSIGQKTVVCPNCAPYRKKSRLKTLTINFNTKSWHCHHCEWAGSLWRGVTTKGDPHMYSKGARQKKEYKKPDYIQITSFPENVERFFGSRGISTNTLKEWKISSGIKYMNQHEKEVHVLKFPYIKDGEVINIKYRGPKLEGKNTYQQIAGAERIPYGYDNLKLLDGGEINHFIITEGEIDALSIWECGEHAVISVPDGAPSPGVSDIGRKLDWLISIEEYIDKAKVVVLAVDNDEPGMKLREELSRRIGIERCYVVKYPDNYKDINEVLAGNDKKNLKALGKEEVKRILENAQPYPISGIRVLDDFNDEIDEIFQRGIKPGLALKWSNLDGLYRVPLGEFTVVTGYKQSGKSVWVEDIAIDFAQRYGHRVGIFSPEHPTKIHIIRLAMKYTGKAIKIQDDKVYDKSQMMSRDEWEEAKRFIANHFFWIERERKRPITPEELIEKKKMLVLRHGCQLFIDDPFNRLDHQRPKDMTIEEYVSWFLEIYSEFDEMNNSHSFLIAHPKNPPPDRKAKKGTMIARARDISGGGMWGNKAKNIISIARKGIEEGTEAASGKPTLIMTQKVKFDWNGQLGMRELWFNPMNKRFMDDEYTQPSQPEPF